MHGRRWQNALALLVTAIALAACTSTEEGLIEQGYSLAYAEGYEHGCASGKATSGGLFAEAQKDESRYQAGDSEYARGWDAGYAKCMADMRAMISEAHRRRQSKDR
jgi:flagellar biosynthesis/type III secretory pathway protein FliH